MDTDKLNRQQNIVTQRQNDQYEAEIGSGRKRQKAKETQMEEKERRHTKGETLSQNEMHYGADSKEFHM